MQRNVRVRMVMRGAAHVPDSVSRYGRRITRGKRTQFTRAEMDTVAGRLPVTVMRHFDSDSDVADVELRRLR